MGQGARLLSPHAPSYTHTHPTHHKGALPRGTRWRGSRLFGHRATSSPSPRVTEPHAPLAPCAPVTRPRIPRPTSTTSQPPPRAHSPHARGSHAQGRRSQCGRSTRAQGARRGVARTASPREAGGHGAGRQGAQAPPSPRPPAPHSAGERGPPAPRGRTARRACHSGARPTASSARGRAQGDTPPRPRGAGRPSYSSSLSGSTGSKSSMGSASSTSGGAGSACPRAACVCALANHSPI